MKIYINFKTKDDAHGGGNQFLKALKKEFKKVGVLSDSFDEANVILFNGYQEIIDLIKCWLLNNKKKRIYRLGPVMSLHRKGLKWKIIDKLIIFTANIFADLVIFQSKWSFDEAVKRGFSKIKKSVIIPNAVDGTLFYKKNILPQQENQKTKLIYTSWSSNQNKGFPLLAFLDNSIDFEKYEFTFVGNSPVKFKNIKVILPLQSESIAEKLRESDIFITPTKDDACSNAIIEALSCGIPVVALDSGANRELVGNGGVLFKDEGDILAMISKVSENLSYYQKNIEIRSINEVGRSYLYAIEKNV